MIKLKIKNIVAGILKLEARLILQKYKPKIIGIAGTVGKTSAKEAVYLVFSRKFNTRESKKSYNSEIGVPLTIIGAESAWSNPFKWMMIILKGLGLILKKQNYPEWLVLEMGVDRPGDMQSMRSWVVPNIAVITALGEIPSHVEYFGGPEEVAEEKIKLAKNLSEDKIVILNGDDKILRKFKDEIKNSVITFGFSSKNDLAASNYAVSADGASFKIEYKGSIVPVRLRNIFGKQYVYTVLTGIAAGISQGMNLVELAEIFSIYKPPPGRLNLLEGIKNSFILDDTYNSSPMAAEAALDALKNLPSKRKIAVLGDMLELGKYTIDEHRRLGRLAKEAGIDLFFAIGPRMKFAADEIIVDGFDKKRVFCFSTSDDAKKEIQEQMQESDLVLVKGSQSMRMEKIVEEIMAHPEQKSSLLVRQEKEWMNR